jgi:hypothetical protein
LKQLSSYWFKNLERLNNPNEIDLFLIRKYLTNITEILLDNNELEVKYNKNTLDPFSDIISDNNSVSINPNLISPNFLDCVVGDIIRKIAIRKYSIYRGELVSLPLRRLVENLVKWLEYNRCEKLIYNELGGYKEYLTKALNLKYNSEYVKNNLTKSIDSKNLEHWVYQITHLNSKFSTNDVFEGKLKIIKDFIIKNPPNSSGDSVSLAEKVIKKIQEISDAKVIVVSSNNSDYQLEENINIDNDILVKSNKFDINQCDIKYSDNSTFIENIKLNQLDGFLTNNLDNKVTNRIYVEEGVLLGKKLLKKLKYQNQNKETTFKNQPRGKIDKKSLYKLNFNQKVFNKVIINDSKPTHIHLSIDGSGSINLNHKYIKILKLSASLIYISKNLPNFRLSISVRNTGTRTIYLQAYTLMLFDSKKDSLKKGLELISRLSFKGGTPEGLSFGVIKDYLKKDLNNEDISFINISDGLPTKKLHENIEEITKNEIKSLNYLGINTLSYLVDQDNFTIFKSMYGKSSIYLEDFDISKISNNINKLLLNE